MKKWYWLVLLISFVTLTGCHNLSDSADKLNADTHKKTELVIQAVTEAEAHVEKADVKVVQATTQPSNPPETTQLLQGAHQDLVGAKKAMSPIIPASIAINHNADESVKLTKEAVTNLAVEKNHYVGYKLRVIMWWGLGISLAVGAILFVIRLSGGIPILLALGELVGPVWEILKWVGLFIFHVCTFGLVKLADLINKHYDAQQAAKATPAADPTAPVLAVPANPGQSAMPLNPATPLAGLK